MNLSSNIEVNDVKWIEQHLSDLISLNDVDAIKMLHNNGYKPNSNTLTQALLAGKYEVAEWLYQIGIEPKDELVHYLIDVSDLNQLVWLYDHGLEFTSHDLFWGLLSCNVDIMNWLDSIGVRLKANQVQLVINDVQHESGFDVAAKLVVWLLDHDYSVADDVIKRIKPRIKG
jgi:hypothetical protein